MLLAHHVVQYDNIVCQFCRSEEVLFETDDENDSEASSSASPAIAIAVCNPPRSDDSGAGACQPDVHAHSRSTSNFFRCDATI